MNLSHCLLCSLLALGAIVSSTQASALNGCTWDTARGPMTFVVDLGTVYVPRDAPLGSPIGTANVSKVTPNLETLGLSCTNDGTSRLTFEALTTTRLTLNVFNEGFGLNRTGATIQTNIPGVGVNIKLGFPFAGLRDNAFDPESDSSVPFRAFHQKSMGASDMQFAFLRGTYTLTKTATIAAGPQTLDGSELFSGNLTDLGKAFGVGITGTIIQAQCTVLSNRVSADPVLLGKWNKADFVRPGYTTPAVPFSITLSDCETDGITATANIRLDGLNGSVPVTPPISGVFTLSAGSTAEGVGIQILTGDGSPIELSTEVPLIPIVKGVTSLPFNARLYQTGQPEDVEPGLAKGALNFSITYR